MGDIILLYEKLNELTMAHNKLISLLVEKKVLNKEDFINETNN